RTNVTAKTPGAPRSGDKDTSPPDPLPAGNAARRFFPGNLASWRLGGFLIVILACALVLLPWVVRNYRAYGRLVPVDTTGGYNLWLGSVGVRDEARLQADLRAIPNPADRQSFAYAR